MTTNTTIENKNETTAALHLYQFILTDGSIVTIAAEDYVSAARAAREMF